MVDRGDVYVAFIDASGYLAYQGNHGGTWDSAETMLDWTPYEDAYPALRHDGPGDGNLDFIWSYTVPGTSITAVNYWRLVRGPQITGLTAGPQSIIPLLNQSTTVNYGLTDTFTGNLTVTARVYASWIGAGNWPFSFVPNSAPVRTITSGTSQAQGNQSLAWDGKNDAGVAVAPGYYAVALTATDSQGATSATWGIVVAVAIGATATYGYDNPLITLSASAPNHAASQPLQYTTEPRDSETGFIYLRARMYDPSIGRFLQRDVVFGGQTSPATLGRYGYAGDNPLTYEDHSGRSFGDPVSGIGGPSGDREFFHWEEDFAKHSIVLGDALPAEATGAKSEDRMQVGGAAASTWTAITAHLSVRAAGQHLGGTQAASIQVFANIRNVLTAGTLYIFAWYSINSSPEVRMNQMAIVAAADNPYPGADYMNELLNLGAMRLSGWLLSAALLFGLVGCGAMSGSFSRIMSGSPTGSAAEGVRMPPVGACWLPSELPPEPRVEVAPDRTVNLDYGDVAIGSEARMNVGITESPLEGRSPDFVLTGEKVQVSGVNAVISASGGVQLNVEWFWAGYHFDLVSDYSRDDALHIVESVIKGCGESPGPPQPGPEMAPGTSETVRAAQQFAAFPIAEPCWIPEGAAAPPRVTIERDHLVTLRYPRLDSRLGLGDALGIAESFGARLPPAPSEAGQHVQVSGTDIVLSQGPNGSTLATWSADGRTFMAISDFDPDVTLGAISSMIEGCGNSGTTAA